MKTEMYSVYDSKAQAYGLPFHAPNDAVALRIFGEAVNDPSTQLNKYPEDFVLFHLGRFDDQTAQFEITNIKSITTALAWRVMTNGQN